MRVDLLLMQSSEAYGFSMVHTITCRGREDRVRKEAYFLVLFREGWLETYHASILGQS